jgi:hypothetical protein
MGEWYDVDKEVIRAIRSTLALASGVLKLARLSSIHLPVAQPRFYRGNAYSLQFLPMTVLHCFAKFAIEAVINPRHVIDVSLLSTVPFGGRTEKFYH